MISVPAFVFGEGVSEGEGETTLELWTQPNVNSERFWKPVIDEFNSTHENIQVDWKTIPTGGSSEEIILTAIATGTQPDICTNIFSGFLAQLVENGVVVALDEEFSDFWDLAKDAKMDNIIKSGWEINGKSYELPMYCNTMQDWYNKDLLAKAGLTEPPRTYSEFLDAAAKLLLILSDTIINSIKFKGYQLKAGHFLPFWLYGNSTINRNLRNC
jgi:multiple sugar transport system substrate-binding protein